MLHNSYSPTLPSYALINIIVFLLATTHSMYLNGQQMMRAPNKLLWTFEKVCLKLKKKKKKNSKFYILFNDTQNFIMGKILFWSLNFTKSLFLVPKLKKKFFFHP